MGGSVLAGRRRRPPLSPRRDRKGICWAKTGRRRDQVVSNRLATTVAVSVLIHAIVLGLLQLPDTSGDRPSLIPELFVRIEPESAADEEDEQLPPPVASNASPMQAPDVLET